MGRRTVIVRMSSKGQVVIPAEIRRSLGWGMGCELAVVPGKSRELILRPAKDAFVDLDAALEQSRAWFADWERRTGRDPLKELDESRRKEREREARRREQGYY